MVVRQAKREDVGTQPGDDHSPAKTGELLQAFPYRQRELFPDRDPLGSGDTGRLPVPGVPAPLFPSEADHLGPDEPVPGLLLGDDDEAFLGVDDDGPDSGNVSVERFFSWQAVAAFRPWPGVVVDLLRSPRLMPGTPSPCPGTRYPACQAPR